MGILHCKSLTEKHLHFIIYVKRVSFSSKMEMPQALAYNVRKTTFCVRHCIPEVTLFFCDIVGGDNGKNDSFEDTFKHKEQCREEAVL